LAAVVTQRWLSTVRRRHVWWPVAAVALTLMLEVMQTQIPGRGPDLSAPVFTLLAVLAATAVVSGEP
jgi:hypothetical protein